MSIRENNNMRFISLNWRHYHVSTLFKINGELFYILDGEGTSQASLNNCPTILVRGGFKVDAIYRIERIPSIFTDFLIAKNRIDIRKKFDINSDDDAFTILYKVAENSNELSKDGFWISSGGNDLDYNSGDKVLGLSNREG